MDERGAAAEHPRALAERDAAVEGAGQPDAVLLAPLTEDTFLHNLHVRYKKDIIYTYVGNALVAVNPCRALPLYSPELVRAYLARAPYQLPPHLYAITATAYRWVRDRNENQCIVITGESGAGKTEAARVCLQAALVAGCGGSWGAGERSAGGSAPARVVAGALTAAGTLLEAFGNAATARNHNASRFGKLLDIEFDFKGEAVGGHISQYLLEKERVCGASEDERNFHVLYQLLAGADVALLKRLKLQRSWEQYRVLRGGVERALSPRPSPRRAPLPPYPTRAAAADKQHFAHTKAAMETLGFDAEECDAIMRLLAFVLKFGNVEFEPQHDIDGYIGTRLENEYELSEACALVGVEEAELRDALGVSGVHERDERDGRDELEQGGADRARALRDRLLAALYSRLFTWLVNYINQVIKCGGGGGGGGGSVRARGAGVLGVLDVYGLERLAHNGLERLLINYAAERVHASVVAATLRRPVYECVQEGVAHGPLPPPYTYTYTEHDAHDRADLLDAGPESVLSILSDSSARGSSDAAFLQRLQRRRHPRLQVSPPDRFQVVHFGGAVWYSASGMVAQNRDALCRRCAGALGGAREPLLARLFDGGGAAPGGGGSPRRPATLACRQRALVTALTRRLAGLSSPRLVRCLRPDHALRPNRFDCSLVRQQIRTQNIVEMVMVRRAGWCESMNASGVLARYGLLREAGADMAAAAAAAADGSPQPVRAARALLRSLPIPSAEFAYGRTKVFIRSPRTVWELEALRAARVERLVAAAQRAWRRHRARLEQQRRQRAQRVIARAWRAHVARRLAVGQGDAAWLARATWAACVVWRAWCTSARRRYLVALWGRLQLLPRHTSPAARAWPPCPAPRLLARTDALLRHLHHRWRCLRYRQAFDQTARNRMREKVTASVLFKDRKASYACSVGHPFVGDYVRLRASTEWRRGAGASPADRYVVFADVVGKVARASGRVARCLAVLSTGALLLLEPRSLRLKRRVPAPLVYRLSLSPYADDVLVVHVACEAGQGQAGEAGGGPSCLPAAAGEARRGGDVVLRTRHALELATKLFLVVQNAAGAPPHVHVSPQFEADFGSQPVTIAFHALGHGPPARLERSAHRMDVLL